MTNYFLVRLKEVRKEKNLTQKQLAELSGFSVYKIRQWEQCFSYPNLYDAVALCIKLDVHLEYLRGNRQSKEITRYANNDDYNFRYVTFD